MEYLQDAAALKEYLVHLKAELYAAPEENRILKWRVDTLYRMYLDCRHTGEYLITRERRRSHEQVPHGTVPRQ